MAFLGGRIKTLNRNMMNTSAEATIRLHRTGKGLLKNKPAIVLFDNRFLHFYPDGHREYSVQPGAITLSINKKKHLTFDMRAGEEKTFLIRESIFDWRFFIKYGILVFLGFLILIAAVKELIEGALLPSGTFALLLCIWALSTARHEYFFLEEA